MIEKIFNLKSRSSGRVASAMKLLNMNLKIGLKCVVVTKHPENTKNTFMAITGETLILNKIKSDLYPGYGSENVYIAFIFKEKKKIE